MTIILSAASVAIVAALRAASGRHRGYTVQPSAPRHDFFGDRGTVVR